MISPNVPQNEWMHVVLTIELATTTATIFVNGQVSSQDSRQMQSPKWSTGISNGLGKVNGLSSVSPGLLEPFQGTQGFKGKSALDPAFICCLSGEIATFTVIKRVISGLEATLRFKAFFPLLNCDNPYNPAISVSILFSFVCFKLAEQFTFSIFGAGRVERGWRRISFLLVRDDLAIPGILIVLLPTTLCEQQYTGWIRMATIPLLFQFLLLRYSV